jgi:hypothetical protein
MYKGTRLLGYRAEQRCMTIPVILLPKYTQTSLHLTYSHGRLSLFGTDEFVSYKKRFRDIYPPDERSKKNFFFISFRKQGRREEGSGVGAVNGGVDRVEDEDE